MAAWFSSIRNGLFLQKPPNLKEVPAKLQTDPAIVEAFEIARISNLTPEEEDAIDRKERWIAEQKKLVAERETYLQERDDFRQKYDEVSEEFGKTQNRAEALAAKLKELGVDPDSV